jgi:hypothetical protein
MISGGMLSKLTWWFTSMALVALQGQVLKTAAHISGTVADPEGAVIPGASIVLRASEKTRTLATATTDDRGVYTLRDIVAGTYELEFDAPGFKAAVRRVIVRGGADTVVPQPRLSVDLSEAICILQITAVTPVDPVQKSND